LYVTRRQIGKELEKHSNFNWSENFYICSFSSRTIVYKGMVPAVLGDFLHRFKQPSLSECLAVYHRRFSTNTMPKYLAQPMRLWDNGEINTLLGNINWMMAREVKPSGVGKPNRCPTADRTY